MSLLGVYLKWELKMAYLMVSSHPLSAPPKILVDCRKVFALSLQVMRVVGRAYLTLSHNVLVLMPTFVCLPACTACP